MNDPEDDGKGAEANSEDIDENPSPRLCDLERRRRDQKLWDLLPPLTDDYDPSRLSNRELSALEEALGDGFGGRFDKGNSASDLPSHVQPALLQHKFYSDAFVDEDGDHWGPDFWARGDDDEPAPFESFPLEFSRIRLRIYFRNQFERYCRHVAGEAFEVTGRDERIFEGVALRDLYEKPWYEVHALRFLDWVEDESSRPHLAWFINVGLAGKLGRLVEQYYWRFRYEKAAITGLGARSGASAGGKVRATQLHMKHAKWQQIANGIWSRRPELKAQSVASEVKKKLKLKETAKHIARYLRRPTKK